MPIAKAIQFMNDNAASAPQIRVSYERLDVERRLGDDVIAAVVFGAPGDKPTDPRYVNVDLEPCGGFQPAEVWRAQGEVRLDTSGPIRFVECDHCTFGWLELDELRLGGLENASEIAYRALLNFQHGRRHCHLWRIWNFIADINHGTGDEERYKIFSLGRARAFAAANAQSIGRGYPAATAVGRPGGRRTVQVFWMAGSSPGAMIENPRQMSAYHYPREYGPAAPSFSRAMTTETPMLLVSGTASIVGHASVHAGNLPEQIAETCRNLEAIASKQQLARPFDGLDFPHNTLLRAYVRPGVDHHLIERNLRQRYGSVACMFVTAEICRRELLLEIEAIHQA